jgi:hypothetical protein
MSMPWQKYEPGELEQIKAPSDIQRAVAWAAIKGRTRLPIQAVQPLIEALRDTSHAISIEDRLEMAAWLNGEYKNKRGAPPKQQRFSKFGDREKRRLLAITLYRQKKRHLKEQGAWWGRRDETIVEAALESGVHADQLRDWVDHPPKGLGKSRN